jgi:TnpA family transposase
VTAPHRTAYPRFPQRFADHDLEAAYTPTDDEVAFARRETRQPPHQFSLLVLLKVFQNLGYFPPLTTIPLAVIDHVRQAAGFAADVPFGYDQPRMQQRHQEAIRASLGVAPADAHARRIALEAVHRAAAVMDMPADLINVAIEELLKHSRELPAFSTLDRLVGHTRAQVNQRLCQEVAQQITPALREQLDGLLARHPQTGRTAFNALKQPPKRPTLSHLKELLDYYDWLVTLGDPAPLVRGLAQAKISQFAAQARALDGAAMEKLREPKRSTFLLCLLHRIQVQTRDHLIEMFRIRMARIHATAQSALQELRVAAQDTTDTLLETFVAVLHAVDGVADKAQVGQQVTAILDSPERIQALLTTCEGLLAYRDNNHLPLVWQYYRSHRSTLYRLARTLTFQSTSADQTLLDALTFLLERQERTAATFSDLLSLAFASEKWRKVVLVRQGQQTVLVRRHLEVCVFSALADELKTGDVCVEGSAAYADFRTALLPWEECEPRVPDYCATIGIPATASAFVAQLHDQLTTTAQEVDQGYPDNDQLTIDAHGEPHLKRYQRQQPTPTARALEEALLERMPERSLLHIVHRAVCRSGCTRHFGPFSGNDPKLDRPQERYILTAFTYGCNLGPRQAARHMQGQISASLLSYINRRHIRSRTLVAALADLVNQMRRGRLATLWGNEQVVGADGTHYRLRTNTLQGAYHIRYGSYGGIAYHHVSDTYVLLMSRFITCGTWESIYILEGLRQNQSAMQPDTIHADTQGQNLPTFALAFLLGLKLMPRIRNLKELVFSRPDPTIRYQHIDALFHETINWELIATHWRDVMQVLISIQQGLISTDWLLRKLSSDSRRSRIYRVFREIGRVIRTIFLLQYLADQDIRIQITATTNKVEAFHHFSQWLLFGDEGVLLTSPDPEEQEKAILYQSLIANAVMDQNMVDMSRIIHELQQEGMVIRQEDIATLSPYLTQHIKRFGDYQIDGLNDMTLMEEDDVPLLELDE